MRHPRTPGSCSGNSGPGLTPGGTIADITFEALSPGTTALALANAFLTDGGGFPSSGNGDFSLQNGSVTVLGAAVPEPGTLAMLGAALMALAREAVKILLRAIGLAMLGALALAGAARAQITENGPYYAPPSWDQQLPDSTRWVVLTNWGGQAVLDRETGLVWQQYASGIDFSFLPWTEAVDVCVQDAVGGRYGWRLPSVEELATLVDPSTGTLFSGAPFTLAAVPIYWTATTQAADTTSAYVVKFVGPTQIFTQPKNIGAAVIWCVRGGHGAQSPQ